MAGGIVWKFKFDTMSGSKTWTFNHAKSSASVEQVKAFGNAMVQNADLFDFLPVRLTEAKIVTTTENVYNLDN